MTLGLTLFWLVEIVGLLTFTYLLLREFNLMTNLLESASKIVFILTALAVVAGLFTKILDPKDFMVLASMAFTFYFSNKGDTSGKLPYAGK
jgi:uncharacterized membrane protein AbrB (regulator of aidB expression)